MSYVDETWEKLGLRSPKKITGQVRVRLAHEVFRPKIYYYTYYTLLLNLLYFTTILTILIYYYSLYFFLYQYFTSLAMERKGLTLFKFSFAGMRLSHKGNRTLNGLILPEPVPAVHDDPGGLHQRALRPGRPLQPGEQSGAA